MNPVEADDRFTDQPSYDDGRNDAATTPIAPAPTVTTHSGAYIRGLATCRAILREHGCPEHGPYWDKKKH